MPKYPRGKWPKTYWSFLSLPLNTVPTKKKETSYSWYHDNFSVWILYSVISVIDIKCLLMVFVKKKKVILSVNYWRRKHPQLFFLCWVITRTNVCPTWPAATSIRVARHLGSHIRNSSNVWITSRMDAQVLLTSGTSTEGVIQKRVVVPRAWKLWHPCCNQGCAWEAVSPCSNSMSERKRKSQGFLVQFVSLRVGFRGVWKLHPAVCKQWQNWKDWQFKAFTAGSEGWCLFGSLFLKRLFFSFYGSWEISQTRKRLSQTKEQECEAALHVIGGWEMPSNLSVLVLSLLTPILMGFVKQAIIHPIQF